MKILSLHCDYIKFKALKKAIKNPEELDNERKKEQQIDEVLVILTAVEQGDDEKSLNFLVNNVKDISSQVQSKNIVLYPYAHLSSNLSKPEVAIDILENAEEELKKEKFNVFRAPFGYYKEFELKCKGHPLAELSRSFSNPKENNLEKSEENYDSKQLLNSISKSKLDSSKLKENDHRILGQKLDLFSFHDVAPGMVFWHNKGLVIYNELISFWREEHKKENYQELKTPQIMDSKLWKVSGHWEKYKENNFVTLYEERPFLVKPMNCPGGMLVYKDSQKSYRDFPIRAGEIGTVHRTELSGVLSGLFRVIQFTQDDAHIFCTDKIQVKKEILDVIKLIQKFYKKFNLDFDHVELSTRPEKRIGSDETWDMAERILEEVLKENKISYKVNKGDGAFYGPKIDFHIRDSQKRTWQLSTIQLDFALPERFDLTYIDKENKQQRPIMLHRVIYGSLERFIGILLEHTNGNLPTWLSPIQVRVISFTDRNQKKAEEIFEKLKLLGIRVDTDFSSSTVNEKVRNAELMKIPYLVTIGDKEEERGTIALKKRGKEEKPKFGIKLDDFLKDLKEEITQRL